MTKSSSLIHQAIEEVNQQLEENQMIDNDPGTVLLGPTAIIDSLTLINLIVTLEQMAEERYGVELSLSSDVSLLSDSHHFNTIGSLTDYVSTLLPQG